MPIRALIADDHELFRSGLRQLLVDVLGAEEVREAETFDQAIEILTNEGAGDLVLVDLRMPGMSGAEALAALRDGFPHAKVSVVSSCLIASLRCDKIGPLSRPASMIMMVMPVVASPAAMAALMGDAPRQRGSNDACTLMQLKRGMSSTFCRRI